MNAAGQFLRKPLISVFIPAYNAEKYVAEALDSVLSQTCSHIEDYGRYIRVVIF